MANLRFPLLALLAILLAFAGVGTLASAAVAQQFNPCTTAARNPAIIVITTVVQLCERDSVGFPSDTSARVPVPDTATIGYIVLLDCGDHGNSADQQNVGLWSDVVRVSLAPVNAPSATAPKA